MDAVKVCHRAVHKMQLCRKKKIPARRAMQSHLCMSKVTSNVDLLMDIWELYQ